MLSVPVPVEEVRRRLAELPESDRLVARVRNGRRSTVISGPPAGITKAAELFEGADPVASAVAFHHPELAEAADLAAEWAGRCGLDAALTRRLVMATIVDPIDWPAELGRLAEAGARWFVDLGPGAIGAQLSAAEARSAGVGVVAPGTERGLRELTVAGAAPHVGRSWASYAPQVVTLPDGTPRVENAFTRMTGRSPVLLAGMTPTTVDPAIVAAAANAGFWAELAGGGQVTEEIMAANLATLTEALEPGRTFAFNTLFLDPYLWRLQVGGQRLVQRARAAGTAIDALVVSAGIPEADEAAQLVEELRRDGIEYVAFKPGTAAQLRQVLAIADAIAPTQVMVQVEGGDAGGHHSSESLTELMLGGYAACRARENVVLVVGGGIGTPEAAAAWVTGTWALEHGHPLMPVDGVLIGTAAMACLEATTSPQVKQLLVDSGPEHVISGRSQLGAPIHELDNAFGRTGRLLDEVAGDAEAVAARRDEIIEALATTAKPWFGELSTMTYAAWLTRFAELSDLDEPSFQGRFHELLQRAEARLSDAERGEIETLFPTVADAGADAVETLLAAFPDADDVLLHPADHSFFVTVCRRPGKPVPFVPVIDAEVRRWWRSDSLWQSHDARFEADAVSVIPGPVAVAGITRVDEPVAELLGRFEAAIIEAAGPSVGEVPALRREDDVLPELAAVLAAPDVVWAGRVVRNPVDLLAREWVIVAPDRVEDAETGASVVPCEGGAELTVPLGTTDLRLRLEVTDAVASGAAPIVGNVTEAMRELLALAGGGATAHAWDPALGADHAGVTGGRDGRAVPDALVGLTWPAVFEVLATRDDVVEGMLDLVHLDHSLRGTLPQGETPLAISPRIVDVAETEVGRVVTVAVELTGDDWSADLVERFAIRGRTGRTPLADPAPAGGTATGQHSAPRKRRAQATLTAPTDLRAFAAVSGDHNPIHTSLAAARLAGLGGPIVHGMWLSAAAQRVLVDGTSRELAGWTARFLAPVRPGDTLDVTADRVGLVDGDEVVEVAVRVEGTPVLLATARLHAPRTAYVFPGQGIQHAGMGMAGFARSAAAREVWERADRHTRAVLGFSVLQVVRDNPVEIEAAGATHRHPDGVLFLTQFTQVAMAVLGAAQMAELRESGAYVEGAFLAGHSVGEYNALAAVSGVLSLEAVIEVVFQRGSVMHTLVPRDAEGRSDYRLAAIRPSQLGLDDADVAGWIAGIAEETGEFLQIANYNLRGSQYAVAGTVAGLSALEAEVERLRALNNGRAAFVLVPGIDVPFHSAVLRGGVDDFRAKLEELLPEEIDPSVLLGRYVPNLVARPFALDEDFLRAILEVAPSAQIEAALEELSSYSPERLARLVLVELLAWQFASPVRWIETQDLLFAGREHGGLGVQRYVEVGVAQSPTLSSLASQTLKLELVKRRASGPVEVLNLERDAKVVLAEDEDLPDEPVEESAPEAASPAASSAPAAAPAAPTAAPGAERPADLPFGAGEATRVLLAWWTKVRPDQLAATDTIEGLTDGASSRRNQLLVDLGGELNLGAIDGAAEAPLSALAGQVTGLARGYKPLGPVLSAALGDHLKKVLGPLGAKQSAIGTRVAEVWQLGAGWAHHVLAEVACGTREGASVRGGDLATLSGSSLDALVDAAVQAVAARAGVSVALPASDAGGTVDAAAVAAVTGELTEALSSTARHLLAKLGAAGTEAAVETEDQSALLAHLDAELGSDWVRATQPAFDARRAVLLDDRWASLREDLTRIVRGESLEVDFTGAGEVVAQQAAFLGRDDIAAAARSTTPGAWADEVAVVTGASRGSIAAGVVEKLLAGGATVVATTSSLDSGKLGFFKDLYRTHARAGAQLWVVPANMASYADVDALVDWVRSEQTRTQGPVTTVVKPALKATLLFPFAAGRVLGEAGGDRAEIEARILLWSVERLVTAAWGSDALHVVLPGSPNRGTFGGDGAYGETKAALDALVNRWHAERGWAGRVTLAHPIIGWVRGTGLMGGNDPMVDAVEAAGVRTWSTDEMASELLALCTPAARASAAERPLAADFAAGLDTVDLPALMQQVRQAETAPTAEDAVDAVTIHALPSPPARQQEAEVPAWNEVTAKPEDVIVIVGAGELGPWGSARTRAEMEVSGELSPAGVLELAWVTGLVRWDADTWIDVESGDPVAEHEIHERYHDVVVERCGIRSYVDDSSMRDHTAPLLVPVYLDEDLTFEVDSEVEAKAMQDADPKNTRIASYDGGWKVTRLAGTMIRVPRRMQITRTAGGQIPTGFDPAAWGIPAELAIDRVAIWNLICTVDAFLGSGFTPEELMRWVHPAKVANTQGTGMGGMTSMQSLYLDTLLGEATPNDLLQEALPNVIAAHVVQSYVGSYGAMIHPVAACATTAVSMEEGVDKLMLRKADFVVTGGFDDLGTEGVIGFANMSATADTEAMRAQGIADRHLSRANDRRRGGFVESQGGGTILLTRGDVAARMGLPVLAVVAHAASYADGVHTSIPAPGIGALAAGYGGIESDLARSLAALGLTADDIAVVSKHDTSTAANDPNESELHERLAKALGRSEGNPLFVISQKTLTGHAKGGAAAFQVTGLCQVLSSGVIPPNRSLDCVDDALAAHPHLVWLRSPLATGPLRAGLVTSLGFGHVSALIALVHPEAFVQSLAPADRDAWRAASRARLVAGRQKLARVMLGEPGYVRPADRRLGGSGIREREAAMLLDPQARLQADGVYA